jgi:chromosomal replication initiation ATPase DnaA
MNLINKLFRLFRKKKAYPRYRGIPRNGTLNEKQGEEIIDAVCRITSVPEILVVSKTRTSDLTYARHLCFYLLYNQANWSLVSIGQRFGNRDHSTVIHGKRKIEALRSTNPKVDADCYNIINLISKQKSIKSL